MRPSKKVKWLGIFAILVYSLAFNLSECKCDSEAMVLNKGHKSPPNLLKLMICSTEQSSQGHNHNNHYQNKTLCCLSPSAFSLPEDAIDISVDHKSSYAGYDYLVKVDNTADNLRIAFREYRFNLKTPPLLQTSQFYKSVFPAHAPPVSI